VDRARTLTLSSRPVHSTARSRQRDLVRGKQPNIPAVISKCTDDKGYRRAGRTAPRSSS
jgi:hypothetical protein